MEALSVYHARPLDGYRQAQDVQLESASTEELRTALIRYRTLFQELVGDPVGQRMFGRRAAATAPDPATEPDAASNGRTRKIAIVPPKTAGTPR